MGLLQGKGDFYALLNAESSKPLTAKQPPVLLNLRNSGSSKPQSSLESATSFATAASSASDVVSEASGPTLSSKAKVSVPAGSINPPINKDPAVRTPPKDEFPAEQPKNSVLVITGEAAESVPDASNSTPEEPSQAAGGRGMTGHEARQGDVEIAESNIDVASSSLEDLSMSDTGSPSAAPGQAHNRDVPPQKVQSDWGGSAHASAAGRGSQLNDLETPESAPSLHLADHDDSQIAESGAPPQESKAQVSATLVKSMQEAESQDLPSSKGRPLEGLEATAAPASSEESCEAQHAPQMSGASPLQSSRLSHETHASNAAQTHEQPHSPNGLEGSQALRSAAENGKPAWQEPKREQILHNSAEEAQGKLGSAAADSAQHDAVRVQSLGYTDRANPHQPHRQESIALSQEPLEELPVSTLAARCLSGYLAEPAGSTAADASSAVHALAHDQHAKEAGDGKTDGQQGEI